MLSNPESDIKLAQCGCADRGRLVLKIVHTDKKARRWAGLGVQATATFLSRDCDAVVIVDGAGSGRIVPIPRIVVAVFRRTLQLAFRYAGAIATEVGIVFQRLPGQRVMFIANAEESAKAEDGVRNPATDLVNHHSFDRSDLFIVGPIYRGAFHLIAAD